MNNIFQTLLYQREKQKDTVLATIVWDDGSAPRGAGSQMLVGAEGLLSGTIGGGAVELRSIQLARALLAGQHVDALYDFKLSRDGELGMACGGDVTVLFTPARLSDRVWDALAAEVLRCVRDRVPGWLVLPLAYFAFVMLRARTGQPIGFSQKLYPYPFLDYPRLGAKRFWLYVSAILTFFFLLGCAFVWLAHRL